MEINGKICIIKSMCQEACKRQIIKSIVHYSIVMVVFILLNITMQSWLLLLLVFLYCAICLLTKFCIYKSLKNKILEYIDNMDESNLTEINNEISFSTYKYRSFYMLSYCIYDPNDNFLIKYEDIVSLTQCVYRVNYVFAGIGLKFRLSNGKSVTIHVIDTDDYLSHKDEFKVQLNELKSNKLQGVYRRY